VQAEAFFPDGGRTEALTLSDLDELLGALSTARGEGAQVALIKDFMRRCSACDTNFVVRLLRKDLHANAGVKVVIE